MTDTDTITDPPGPLNVSGLVRAVRRRADLSQRELADRAGVAKTTVERIEAQRVVPTLRGLEKLLSVADLALVATDQQYRLVQPMLDVPGGGLLDGAGRRYPAHSDVVLLADGGRRSWWGGKYGLARPPETYHRSRGYREAMRKYSQWDVGRPRHRGTRPPLTPEQWLRRYPEDQ
ncbi:helix-turn-helix domain-containing protein [Pseudonocardia pini]|uniref:helix-turn-helix domain-containing protein n=1 Tax=Pseudonocardia pini TaxID=2758030 RepID=UPI0015F0A034|nr:helix-turn-helix transcriptional regulator [Pseudonocardia pini]